MKSLVVCLGFVASCVLVAMHASAQPSAPQQPARAKAAVTAYKTAPSSPKVRTAAANAKASAATPAAPVKAASEVAASGEDGLLAQATAGSIQPPADGFEYER